MDPEIYVHAHRPRSQLYQRHGKRQESRLPADPAGPLPGFRNFHIADSERAMTGVHTFAQEDDISRNAVRPTGKEHGFSRAFAVRECFGLQPRLYAHAPPSCVWIRLLSFYRKHLLALVVEVPSGERDKLRLKPCSSTVDQAVFAQPV